MLTNLFFLNLISVNKYASNLRLSICLIRYVLLKDFARYFNAGNQHVAVYTQLINLYTTPD